MYLRPAEAAEETARQIEETLSRTPHNNPMQAEILIQLAASWRVYAHLLTNKCTCGHGGSHNPYNKHCDLVPHVAKFLGGI